MTVSLFYLGTFKVWYGWQHGHGIGDAGVQPLKGAEVRATRVIGLVRTPRLCNGYKKKSQISLALVIRSYTPSPRRSEG